MRIRDASTAALVGFTLFFLASSALVTPALATPPLASSPPFDAAPTNLANDGMHAFAPGIGASGANAYVAWADETPNTTPGTVGTGDRCPAPGLSSATDPGVYDLLVSGSHDGGGTWSKPIDLVNRAITTQEGLAVLVPLGGLFCGGTQFWTSPHIRIAISGSNVYVVWGENVMVQGDDLDTGHPAGIFYAYSSNGGATFSTAVNLAGAGENGNAFNPEIAASGNNVYIVWESHTTGKDVFYERSTDGGKTFNGGNPVGTPINLSNNGNSAVPKIGAAGNVVDIVWQDDTISTGDIGMMRSNDGGATFLPELNVSNDGSASDPVLGVTSSGSALVAWQDGSKAGTTSNGDIFVGGSADGTTRGTIVDLTSFHGPSQPAIGDGYDPQIAVSDVSGGAIAYVTWLDTSPGYTAVYVGSVAGGTMSTHALTDSNVPPSNPRIESIGTSFYVTWTDNSMSPSEELELASGTAVSNAPCCDGVVITLTSQTNDGREMGNMAVGGKSVYTTWHDHTQPQGQVDVRVYTALPQPPVITSPADGSTVTTATPTISGTSDPPLSVQVFDGSTLVGTATPDPTTGAWSVTISALSTGSHSITAVAVDSSGKSNPSGPITIIVSLPTTTTSSSSSSTSSASSSSSATSSSSSSGIPEFPSGLLATAALTTLIAAAYLIVRRNRL